MVYEIYTDGATSNNGYENSYGGWAWILIEGDTLLLRNSGFIDKATNNICELTAIAEACERAAREIEPEDKVIVYSDSAYCVNCYVQKWYKRWMINGWKTSKKEPVANKELWKRLIPFFEKENFTFFKVKGHSGNKEKHGYWNDIVDKMAVEAKYMAGGNE